MNEEQKQEHPDLRSIILIDVNIEYKGKFSDAEKT